MDILCCTLDTLSINYTNYGELGSKSFNSESKWLLITTDTFVSGDIHEGTTGTWLVCFKTLFKTCCIFTCEIEKKIAFQEHIIWHNDQLMTNINFVYQVR